MSILNIPSPENAVFQSIPTCAAWHSFFPSATATNESAPFRALRAVPQISPDFEHTSKRNRDLSSQRLPRAKHAVCGVSHTD
jgi:hypothetical protein